ncbi:MAG: APC family permease [Candidatus Nanosalina sp.]
MPEKLGLKEVVAMGVGGVVGGGIFAVLGVAAKIAGNAAFISYFLSGLIALASAYSYVKMTEHLKEEGGSFTFLEHYVSNNKIAGMVGWILIVGYIGTMAMYAFAFGSFAANLLRVQAGSLIRGTISVGILAVFVGVNLLGVRKSGESEDLLVYAKVAILLLFGFIGLWTIFTRPEFSLFRHGVFNKGAIAPIIGIGTIFVSFEGWQLLTYEYSDIEGGIETLKKGVIWTIITSTLIYILTAVVTTSLVPTEMIIKHKETVLAFAAGKIFASQILTEISRLMVSLAALFSTASAINATLFGTARFSHKIATENELPEIFSFRNRKGVPTKSLMIIGALTALFTFTGSLEEITTFASLSFILIFGVVNYVCLKDSELEKKSWIPVLGLTGTLIVFILELWHLYTEEPGLLIFVGGIFTSLFFLEFLYFEREEIEEEAEKVEEEAEELEEEAEEMGEELEENVEELEEELEKESEEEAEKLAEELEDSGDK